MRRYLSSVMGVLFFLVGLGAAQSALAITTTLTFDDIPSATDVTNQYAGVGVTAFGATAFVATSTPWSANSGLNIAFSPVGGMVFILNPAITGLVKSGSLYLSGDAGIGLFAFDTSGALVAQVVSAVATDNLLFSFTSSGNPIETISIHDGGSSFAIDTLTFVSAAAVPEPATIWLLGMGLLGLMGMARPRGCAPVARRSPLNALRGGLWA